MCEELRSFSSTLTKGEQERELPLLPIDGALSQQKRTMM
jgi:hypothetical protein